VKEKIQAQKLHSFEPHSVGIQRRHEVELDFIRTTLGLTKDFDLKECELSAE
jgi:hypothetical protein